MRLLAVALAFATSMAILAFPAAQSSHADGTYDQPVWFQWTRNHIDALIFPADHGPIANGDGVLGGNPAAEAGPCTNSYTLAMKQSALDWKVAIAQYGANHTKLVPINIYVIGCDPTPPAEALRQPEILVNADENKATTLGTSLRKDGTVLGVSVGTLPCLVLNSKMFIFSFTYNDMYSVAGHEFGHCLGLDHVVDEHPDEDILDATIDEAPGEADNPRHCASNLNVETLDGAFATVMGVSGGGVSGSVPVDDYQQIAC